jgi:hypothetical protein
MKVILCLAMIGVAGYQLGQHFFWFLSSFHIFPTVSLVILPSQIDNHAGTVWTTNCKI